MLTLGIDIGSTTTKIAFFDGTKFPHIDVLPTGAQGKKTVARLVDDGLRVLGVTHEDIGCTISTGYGRRLLDHIDGKISEITANARAVLHEMSAKGISVRTIIDIGGQDSKVISLDENGVIRDFAMNDRCAAGTGRFLEVMSRILEVEVVDLGLLDRDSEKRYDINATCTVFAESEVVSLLARGAEVPDIINAVHRSIARRVTSLVSKMSITPAIVCDGGPSMNDGLVRALEGELGFSLHIPSSSQIMAAKGAALVAFRRISGAK